MNNMYTQLLKMLSPDDPRIKIVTHMMAKNGGDPKKAFYALAKEKGIDPNSVLNMLNK